MNFPISTLTECSKGEIMLETIKALETEMWEAAKARDAARFLSVVEKDAVMVCGGYRCHGSEYAGIISDFDCAAYDISGFEIVAQSESIVQVHYVLKTEAALEENRDLSGTFHIVSTYQKKQNGWKLIFNMDSRILGQ